MACYSPLPVFRRGILPSGKQDLVILSRTKANLAKFSMRVPCSGCIGCRLARSSSWAVRCMHEASLYDSGFFNCFITLTYSDKFLPTIDGCKLRPTLVKRDFQLFMKRLRKRFGDCIRFYMCGEYGDRYGRPHYHAILFNHVFKDMYPWEIRNGFQLFRSDDLEDLWKFGHSSIGSVTFESAAYVARYIMKKVGGDLAENHYSYIDHETGEYFGKRISEFTNMSRRPGIASEWYEKFGRHCVKNQKVVVAGRELAVPKYYENQYEIEYPDDMERIKEIRYENMIKRKEDNTEERLAVKKFIVEDSYDEKFPRLLDFNG